MTSTTTARGAESKVEGEIDLLGVLGLDPEVRNGYLDGVRHDAGLVVDAIVDRLAGTARRALSVQP